MPKKKQIQNRLRNFFLADDTTVSDSELRKRLIRLVFLRVIILSILMGANTWNAFSSGLSTDYIQTSFGLIAFTYVISLFNLICIHTLRKLRALTYIQFSVDVMLASMAIYVTGSAACIALYLILTLGAAILFNQFGAVYAAALSGICYGILTSGLLKPVTKDTIVHATPMDVLSVYLSLVGIALIGSYFGSQIKKISALVREKEKDLSEYTSRHRQMINDISDGIITLDLESCITSINQAAQSIIGLSSYGAENCIGEKALSMFKEHGLEDMASILYQKTNSDGLLEVCVQNKSNGEDLKLECQLKSLKEDNGKLCGKTLYIKDISRVKDMEERLNLQKEMNSLLSFKRKQDVLSKSASMPINMVGRSQNIKDIFSLIKKVSPSKASILITGESGTGKELIAQAIHNSSDRAGRPFVAVNCGAIPENLIESELFGHKKGAFTGADRDTIGLFRQANGGTIFLDEVGELPLHLQTKLLRVLQEHKIRPVGDVEDIDINVRVISATNKNLKQEIKAGAFREDVYYRLNVVTIEVPPLRDRKEDITLLISHFLGSHFNFSEHEQPHISAECLQILNNYTFPGNVRELENIIERAVVLGGMHILPEHLPEDVLNAKTYFNAKVNSSSNDETSIIELPINLEQELATLEQHYLNKALEQTSGARKKAAQLLGLNFRSFRYRVKKYGLHDGNDEDVEITAS